MNTNDFTFSFTSTKQPSELFPFLLNANNWWSGLFGEQIEGKFESIGDEFSYKAGNGVHFSNQKLVESLKNKRIGWLVTESNLSFLHNTNEWAGTKICFDIEQTNTLSIVTFTHEGLTPVIECYNQCTSAWTKYLHNLELNLK